jgi:hypothetical protein
MKPTVLACAALLLLPLALAAQKSAKEAEQPENPKLYRPYLTPGEQHKTLEPFVGSWKAVLKVWGPGSPPIENKIEQTMETRWALNGNFLQSDVTIKSLGRGLTRNLQVFRGYNSAFKRYTAYQMSNVDVRDIVYSGSYDAATRTFTFKGEEKDPVRNDAWVRKEVFTLQDRDHFRLETFLIFQDGSEAKIADGVFERVVAPAAPGAPEPPAAGPKKDGPP